MWHFAQPYYYFYYIVVLPWKISAVVIRKDEITSFVLQMYLNMACISNCICDKKPLQMQRGEGKEQE